MKYQKGSFILAPNKHVLDGQPPIVQTVFVWICSYANEDGECWPSRSLLARNASCSVDSVDNAIKKLVELGLLEKTSRTDGESKITNLYQIRLVADTIGQGSRYGRLGVADDVGIELNPVLTKSNELYYVATDSEKQKKKTDLEGFAVFRDLYPLKKDMASASAEWRRLSKRDRELALADLPKRIHSQDWKKNDGEFIPLPKNYLKGRRWEDEVTITKTKVLKI